jgi:hypothetical protein
MNLRSCGVCIAIILLFPFAVAAQVNLSITSSPATLTVGSDTILFPGNVSSLTTTISPNTSTPLATAGVTFTASTLTVADAAHPAGLFHGFVSQTFTVNGVSVTVDRVVEVFATPARHSYSIQSGPATLELPEGTLTFSGFTFFGPVTPPGSLTPAGSNDDWLLIPHPTTPNTFTIYTDFPMSTLGGLVGNLVGGISPQQVTLTPNVPTLIGYNNFSGFFTTLPRSGGGVSTPVTQTVTVGGVSTPVTRTLSTSLTPSLICPGDTVLSRTAAMITADLGPAGKVDVTMPALTTAGEFDCGQPLIIVPGALNVTLLLHDVPPPTNVCPLTQGFWKNHPQSWPVTSLTIGGITYTRTQLLTVMGNSAGGDAVVILADQLIAALLNIDNGSDPSSVSAVIADAQTQLTGINLLSHTAVPTKSAKGQQMQSDASVLDSYNNDNLTPNCTVRVPGQ